MKKYLLLLLISLFALPARAGCLPATATPPSSVVGLHLLRPEQEQGWKDLQRLGVNWARVEVFWNLTEPTPDDFRWGLTDSALHWAAKYNINVMLMFNNMPDWLMQQDRADLRFTRLLQEFFTRYAGHLQQVKAYEIFNEPNNPGFGWLSRNRSPESNAALEGINNVRAFASFLRTANAMIRPNDRQAFIVSGGLFSRENSEGYLQQLMEQGVASCFDIVGYHPYANAGHFAEVQQRLERLSGKPVWMTEYGTTDNNQREALLRQAFAELPRINALFWFVDRDFGLFSDTYGLRDYLGHAKPAYQLFQKLAATSR